MTSGLTNRRILLDTKPLMKLFAKEEGWEAVQKIIARIEEGKISGAISVITLTEVYYKYLHEKRADLAKKRIDELNYATYLNKIGIDEKIAVQAGDFKGKYSIPIADAIIAATAFDNDLIVITDDLDFKKVNEIKVKTEQEFITSVK